MTNVSGYSIRDFGEMITCEPRMSVYAEALRRAITPGCNVFDIGAGFGVFTLLACKYGAGSVVAIEPDVSAELIMPLALANGCADRITVIRGISQNYAPPAPADVIISDLRGRMPLYGTHIESIVDARTRLLKPGGHQLPLRDTIRAALVRAPALYRSCHLPWVANDYGLDLSLGHTYAVNEELRGQLRAQALMSDPCDLEVIDYRSRVETDLDSTVELIANRAGEANGVLVWFDATIAEGLSYSNAPGQPPLVYGQMFLPLATPVRLAAGDRATFRLRGLLKGARYIWSWDTAFSDGRTGEAKAAFRQSTFKRDVLSASDLKPYARDHVPPRSPELMIDRDCLELAGTGLSVGAIARELFARHGDSIATEQAALDRVTKLLSRYERQA